MADFADLVGALLRRLRPEVDELEIRDGEVLEPEPPRSVRRVLAWWGAIVFGVVVLVLWNQIFFYNAADTIKVRQALNGDLFVRIRPGIDWRLFGKITTYDKSEIIWFSSNDADGESADQSILVRYTDGGTAKISGTARWVLPFEFEIDDPEAEARAREQILALHKAYRTQKNFVDRAIYRLVKETVQQTAGFFTTEESYTTKKSSYADLVRDQVEKGVLLVEQMADTTYLQSGETKVLSVNVPRRAPSGEFLRKQNPLKEFGVRVENVVVYDPDFQGDIPSQIARKFDQKMKRIVSQSEASLETQQTITAQATGERDVMTKRYEQLVRNVTEEIRADREREVARIKAEGQARAAEIRKEAQEWLGKAEAELGRGEGRARVLLQEADSNLEVKVAAVKAKHRAKADAIKAGLQVMPEVILGGEAQQASSPSADVLELLKVNQALDLRAKMQTP